MTLAIVVLGYVSNPEFQRALDQWRQTNGGTLPTIMIDEENDAGLQYYITLRDLENVKIRNVTKRDVVFTMRDYYLLQNTEYTKAATQLLIIRSNDHLEYVRELPYFHWNRENFVSQGEAGINYQRYADLKNKASRQNIKVVEYVC